MTRGRPVSTASTWECHLHLRLRIGEDDDLIAFLRGLPARKRASAIKMVLRTGGMASHRLETDEAEAELFAAADDFLK